MPRKRMAPENGITGNWEVAEKPVYEKPLSRSQTLLRFSHLIRKVTHRNVDTERLDNLEVKIRMVVIRHFEVGSTYPFHRKMDRSA